MKFKLIFFFIIISFSVKAQTFESAKEKLNGKYQYISHPEKGVVIFREHNGKMGVMDTLCNITAPAKFDYTSVNCNGRIEAGILSKGKMKRGYINKKGEIKIPFIYDDIFNSCDSQLVIVDINTKKGAVDSLNNIKIPIEYNYITNANEDRYIVEKNKRYAVFNVEGQPITGFDFTDMERYYNGVATVVLPDNSVTVINLGGKPLFRPLKGYRLGTYKEDICRITNIKTGKGGFIDKTGKFIIPCDYDGMDDANNLVKLEKNKKWGLFTRNHEAITEIKYDYIFSSINDLYIVKDKNWGIINASGKEIVASVYDHIDLHDKKYFVTRNNTGNYGIFNAEGKNTIPFDYIFYRLWQQKVFVTKENKPVILNLETGNTVSTDADGFAEKTFGLYENWNKQVFVKNGKYGVLSIENEIIVPAEYDALEPINVSGEFIAKRNNKYGIIDSKNTIIQPIEFDKIFIRKEYAELTRKNKKPVIHSVKYRDYSIKVEK